jgi:hypothetical protein
MKKGRMRGPFLFVAAVPVAARRPGRHLKGGPESFWPALIPFFANHPVFISST